MPRTALYANLTEEGPTSLAEGFRISQERMGGRAHDFEGDEKTLESASSTLLAAALDPEFESQYRPP
jgi:hypothetical protein